MPLRQSLQFVWVFAVVLIAGCNGNVVTVEGRVTVNGKPADDGTISFAPADGNGPSVGGAIKDGRYQLSGKNGVTPGTKTVSITAMLKTGKQVEAGPPLPKGTMVDVKDRFAHTDNYTVTAERVQQHDFDWKQDKK